MQHEVARVGEWVVGGSLAYMQGCKDGAPLTCRWSCTRRIFVSWVKVSDVCGLRAAGYCSGCFVSCCLKFVC